MIWFGDGMQRNYRYYKVNDIASSGFSILGERKWRQTTGRATESDVYLCGAKRIRSGAFSLIEETVAWSVDQGLIWGGLRMI